MRLRAAGAFALLALAASESATAMNVLLPSPTRPLDTTLPLEADAVPVPPVVPVNARIANREVVTANVLRDGTVVGVRVLQRLDLSGTGDFFFQIDAPVQDVRAGPLSQAEPGFRRTAILWQGFVNRRRVLEALAELVPAEAADALPLRVELTGDVLRIRNATEVRAAAFAARADPQDVQPVLEGIAARPLLQRSVRVQGPAARRDVVVTAPLRVRGTVRRGPRVVQRFTRILGGSAPVAVEIPVRSGEIALEAEPVRVLPELRRTPPEASGSELVLLASTSLLRLARAHQYNAFLANPDRAGPTRTLYRYRVVRSAVSAAPAQPDESRGTALTVLLAAGAVLASAGLVVLWARL